MGINFGGYITSTIDEYDYYINDNNAFVFSLNSNGRPNELYKFEEKETSSGIMINMKSNNSLFQVYNTLKVYKNHYKHPSYISENEMYFDFHGITNTLQSVIVQGELSEDFVPKRIIIIQME